jgi:SAM-dependent methyltransferase
VFASVYDQWYPDDGRGGRIAAFLGPPPPDGRLLELGIGTGTIARSLARSGWQVTGMDDSPSMLARLEHDGAGDIVALRADVARPEQWPDGPFDAIVAATNLLANLIHRHQTEAAIGAAAASLAPDGCLVVELFVAAPPARRERRLVLSTQVAGVRIHTDTDPRRQVVRGRHVRCHEGRVEVWPWTIRWYRTDELDSIAAAAGLRLAERWAGWGREPWDAGRSTRHVSVYRHRR